ncbi:NADH-ubiquinone oxidoreductase 49kDa subunit [Acetobacter oeni LMG 21952]|nr:NADH-ubiquinone oxidoreductase 49kDa subunit [Acetobacter oeni LMG 21952]
MASYTLEGPRYRGLSGVRAAAAPFERMIRDLWGVEAMEASDTRPLIDHGAWTSAAPLATRSVPSSPASGLAEFEPPDKRVAAHGMIFGRGPATGNTEGPVHFRLGVADGVIRTVETRAGYAHRGITARMREATLASALHLAGRVGAGSAVAHQWAFSAAAENALGIETQRSTNRCRVVFCETERIATHLLILARTARAADAQIAATGLYGLRERILQLCEAATGHRLLMDCVCFGREAPECWQDNVTVREKLQALCGELMSFSRSGMKELELLWRTIPGFRQRLQQAGRLSDAKARALELQGVAGRACGHGSDLRTHLEAYDDALFRPVVSSGGDALTRCDVMFEEISESFRILESISEQLLNSHDNGETGSGPAVVMLAEPCKGYAAIEGPHGPVWYVVSLQDGRVRQCYISDPASRLLMALEQSVPGTTPDNFDLVRCSFGISIAAADL